MLIPRLGAIILLIGLGFALAQLVQLLYVVAAEGHLSWLPVLGFVAPTGIIAVVSAILVLRRNALGARLIPPLVVLVIGTAAVTLLSAPPVGRFLDDYEESALDRGVTVPQYRLEQGWSEERYVQQRTSDVRSQGVLGAVAAVGLYAFLVRARPGRRRSRKEPGAASAT